MGQNQSLVDYVLVLGEDVIGAVALLSSDTLHHVRQRAKEDGIPIPKDFQFMLPNGAPVSSTQEHTRTVANAATEDKHIRLRALPVPQSRRESSQALDELFRVLGPLYHLDDALIKEQAQSFVEGTRQWVFDAFDDWVAGERSHRVFVLSAQAGVGKTGLMCKLARDRRDVVVARHFCRHDDSRRKNPRAMLLSLAYQLAASIPEYCDRIKAHIQKHRLTRSQLMGNEYDTTTLFTELFQTLLCDLEVDSDLKSRRVILIDAIDECERSLDGSKNGILDCIRKYFCKLPSWLGVFITTRPELPITEKLKQFNPIEVEPNMEDNLRDLEIFFHSVLKEESIRKRVKSINTAQAVEALVSKSCGLFIYAVMAAEALRSGRGSITITQITQFPEGLHGFYQEQMERTFPDKGNSLPWEIVEFAIAALEPLHVRFLQRLLSCSEAQLKSAVQELSLFFPVQDHRIQLYHKSLKDWLISDDRYESTYHVSLEKVERRLALACVNVLRDMGVVSGLIAGVRPSSLDSVLVQYPLRHCVEHLCSVAMVEEAKSVVLDVGWLVTKAELGESLGLVDDCLRLGKDDRVVELLGRSVSLSQDAVRIDPRQISGQLVGRLTGPASWGGGESEEVQKVLAHLVERLKLYNYGWSWWCPVTATWDQANTVCLRVLAGHSGAVRCVEWSRDGKWIVSGSSDSQVRLWDVESGECVQLFKDDTDKVNRVALSSDGSKIAVAYNSKLIIIDVLSGEIQRLFSHRRLIHARSIGWSPADKFLSIGANRKIFVCTLRGEIVDEISASDRVCVVVWAHELKGCSAAVAAAVGRNICVFGITDDNKLQRRQLLEGHSKKVSSVAWSNDNSQILSGSEDWTVRLWCMDTGQCTRVLKGNVAAWSHDCTKIICASKQNSVSIWDLATGKKTHTLVGHTAPVLSVAWSPDGMEALSASADHTVRVWDLKASGASMRQQKQGHLGYVTSKSWSSSGKYLVTASVDRRLLIWDASTGKIAHILTGHESRVFCVACSSGANEEMIASGSNDGIVRIWGLLSASCVHELKGHSGGIKAVAWSNNDAFLASGSVDSIRIWDPLQGACLKIFSDESSNASISSLAWSPDGKTLASASKDHHYAFWDVAEEKCKTFKSGKRGNLWFLAYSDDGRHIMSTLSSTSASIIDAASGELKEIHDSDIRPKLSQMHFSGVMSSRSLRLSNVDSVEVDASHFHAFNNRACNVTGDTVQFFTLFEQHSTGSEGNKIMFLQSDPLVYKDGASGKLMPMPRLAFARERQLMHQCLVDASRDVKLSFQAATSLTMQDAVINKVELLHFSGHGAPTYLFVEDGLGGAHFLDRSMLEELYPCKRERGHKMPPHKLVFVSACYSRYLAEVFVSAGVSHVVCCQHDAELEDEAANTFMRTFYLALVVGHSVKVSFEMGRQAVASGPFVFNPLEEKEKFVLLPDEVSHDENVIFAKPAANWDGDGAGRSLHWIPSMPEPDSKWQVDMYFLMQKVLHHRLVSLVGMEADLRISLATALCQYIHDRRSTSEIYIDVVLCLTLDDNRSKEQCAFASTLLQQLVAAGKASPIGYSCDQDGIFYQELMNSLRGLRPLLFVPENCDSSSSNEWNKFLGGLLQSVTPLKVLRTADGPTNDSYLRSHEELYELMETE